MRIVVSLLLAGVMLGGVLLSGFFGRASGIKAAVEWPEYHGGPGRNNYSPLTAVTPANAKDLQVAWEFHTGDSSGLMPVNPIVVDGVLYGLTASSGVFALDAASGKVLWRFSGATESNMCRGVAYWAEGSEKRILFTAGTWLYALDAASGNLIESFGQGGRTSLYLGLPENARNKFIRSTTPGTIYLDLIVMPVRVSEGPDAAPGHIRAFNVRTGELAWTFRTIPHPGEPGHETWRDDNWKNIDVGAANNWAGMSVDRKRGILYVPTGSAGYDFYGGNRPGDNLYANCLLALDAATGKYKWHFQFVHHDLWDRDLPAPPVLVQVERDGRKIDAVAQATKSGFVFVFDRETGRPLFPVKEMAVPVNGLPGEKPSPTQPVPDSPAPFARQSINEGDINPYAENKEELQTQLRTLRHRNQFELPSLEGTLLFPGFDGGAEWGGSAYDAETGLLYINSNEMAYIMTMESVEKEDVFAGLTSGHRLYRLNCATCHGAELQGNPASGFPALKDIGNRLTQTSVRNIVKQGKGMMPGFPHLAPGEMKDIQEFLFGLEKEGVGSGAPVKRFPLPYKMARGYKKFLDKNGYPAISPPWGQLSALNLNTGAYEWKITLGEFKELSAKGIPPTGCENYGGAVVTAGGVLFIAATKDEMFRVFDKRNGALLYETKLPAGGFATPAVYEADGRQFVVIACGGTKLGTKKGDSYVAFALPL